MFFSRVLGGTIVAFLVEIFFVLIINLGFLSLNSSSCGPAFEDGMGGKKHQNGKPRVSSKNLVFWDEPYVFVVFGGTRYIYIYIETCYPGLQRQIEEFDWPGVVVSNPE